MQLPLGAYDGEDAGPLKELPDVGVEVGPRTEPLFLCPDLLFAPKSM